MHFNANKLASVRLEHTPRIEAVRGREAGPNEEEHMIFGDADASRGQG